jgi:APA family basic amino acid/polyamine antiporter
MSVAAMLTGTVPWPNVNIESPIAQAFLDRGLNTALDTAGTTAKSRPRSRNRTDPLAAGVY